MRYLPEIEIIKKSQAEILELKNSINKMKKCSTEHLQQSRAPEDRISEVEGRNSEISQLEGTKKKNEKKRRKHS